MLDKIVLNFKWALIYKKVIHLTGQINTNLKMKVERCVNYKISI